MVNKLFQSFLLPILTYNAEIWSAYEKNDFDSWDSSPVEKERLHFYKS